MKYYIITYFSSIFNTFLLKFLPEHYIIRNIVSSELTIQICLLLHLFISAKHKNLNNLIFKILLKSFHNQHQLVIIAKCNSKLFRKEIPFIPLESTRNPSNPPSWNTFLIDRIWERHVIGIISALKRGDLEPRSIAIYSRI